MQISQLGQLHVAFLHCHFCWLYYITTSFDIASFFIENFYFFLISFVNRSRLSEFCCLFISYDTQVYIQCSQGSFLRPYFLLITLGIFIFSICVFIKQSLTIKIFQSPLPFVYSLRLRLFDRFAFLLVASFLYVKRHYATTLGNQSQDQVAMVENGP